MNTKLGYLTCATLEEAKNISKALVEHKLAACANILSGLTSIFVWDKKMQEAQEVLVLFKTNADKCDAAIDLIKSRHSYECPCIVFLDVEKGNTDFLTWIDTNLD